MMIYRVDISDDTEGSCGYEYFGNKRDAIKAKNAYAPHHHPANSIDSLETPRTKKEMIDLLNWCGGHPNNG